VQVALSQERVKRRGRPSADRRGGERGSAA